MMSKYKLALSGLLFFLTVTIQAQVSVSINIGTPPPWGPAGYNEVQYYYLPDVEAYYDIHSSNFIYYSGSTWVHRTSLPGTYSNYDLYGGYKVVLTDYHGNTPYTNFKDHKAKYAKGYNHGQSQKTIGEKPGKGHSDNGSGKDNGKHDSSGKNSKKN